MVFVQFNETDIHVHEGDGYARICLYVKDVRDELLRAVVLYTFSEDSSAKSKLGPGMLLWGSYEPRARAFDQS